MVRTVLAVILGLLVSIGEARAQQFVPKLGLVGGVNLTHVDFTDTTGPSDTYHGKTLGGGGALLTMPLLDRLAVRMDLMWLLKGQRFSGAVTSLVQPASLDLTFFQIPLMGVLDLTGGRWRPYVIGGPGIGFILGADIHEPGSVTDFKHAFRAVEWSVTSGAGVAYVTPVARFFLEARYLGGLNNIEKSTVCTGGGVSTTCSPNPQTMKTKGVLILLGVSAR